MEKKLHIFVCQRLGHRSYAEFDEKLKELGAVPLMHSIRAARTVFTATELKDALRKLLIIRTESLSSKSAGTGPADGPKMISPS